MIEFGATEPGLVYRDRPCAFGIVVRDNRIACVRVERGPRSYHDLPGGAIDGEETEEQALAREFIEETGLTVRGVTRLGEAAQRYRKSDGEPVRNLAGFWTADLVSENPSAKVEDDHTLEWLEPLHAIASLRHEAHAWAVLRWLRARA
ncbi:NUDIX domain-containing protein [Brevundimonas sp.]|uniref:NUDIX domain-containing protein n=1 Tax=Brevundimonas sp. TaxID=1871086 RepID=UPI0025D039AC|nr:NUDIX domain-containing protein [Brevundimonas sp.]